MYLSSQLFKFLMRKYLLGPLFAPYYDTFLDERPNLLDIAAKTGQKSYHLAFALGGKHSEFPNIISHTS